MQAAVRLTAGKPVSIRVDYSSSARSSARRSTLRGSRRRRRHPAAVEAARHADAAIVLANQAAGEGMDHVGLGLPGDQDQLIDAVAAVNRRTIVVLDTAARC
jgi:beta-glucosidase